LEDYYSASAGMLNQDEELFEPLSGDAHFTFAIAGTSKNLIKKVLT